MLADIISSIGGLVIGPVLSIIKQKFLPSPASSPESTLATLATTAPDQLASYVEALATWCKSKKELFNRDVIGMPSVFIINLRASIRPNFVYISMAIFFGQSCLGWKIDPGTRNLMEVCISSWFGSRIKL